MSFTRINQAAPARWTSQTFSYSFPSGAPSAGQLDIIGVDFNATDTLTIPSGWTAISATTTGGGGNNSYLLYKIAGASDPSSVALNSNMGASDEAILCWARYSATGTITADTSGTAANSTNASTSPSISVSLAGSGELVVAYVACVNGTAMSGLSWSTGYTAVANGSDGGFGGVTDALGENLTASGTQSPNLSWTSGGLENQAILVLAFQSAAATGAAAGGTAVRGRKGRRGAAQGSPPPLVHLEDVPAVPSGAAVRGRTARRGAAQGSPPPVLVHIEDVPPVPSGAAVKGRRGARGSSQGSKPVTVFAAPPQQTPVPATGAAVKGRRARKGASSGSPAPLVRIEELPAPSGAAVRGRPGRKGRAAGSQPIPVVLAPLPPAATGKTVTGRRARTGRAQGSPAAVVAAFVQPQQGTVTISNTLAGLVTIVNNL